MCSSVLSKSQPPMAAPPARARLSRPWPATSSLAPRRPHPPPLPRPPLPPATVLLAALIMDCAATTFTEPCTGRPPWCGITISRHQPRPLPTPWLPPAPSVTAAPPKWARTSMRQAPGRPVLLSCAMPLPLGTQKRWATTSSRPSLGLTTRTDSSRSGTSLRWCGNQRRP